MLTNFSLVAPKVIARPKYLEPVAEVGFDTTLTRIAGDTGTAIAVIGDDWDLDARHGYSRRNPWNCDGTLAYIEQRGGSPSKMILDAKTWKPLKGSSGNFKSCTEVRWHPTLRTVMIGWNKSTLEIVVFDALTDVVNKRVKVNVPFVPSPEDGKPINVGLMGEGSLSNDGSMVALGDITNRVVLVNIADSRVSPVQKVDFLRAPGHQLGNCTISPLSTPAGGKFVAKASDTPELVRVYKYGADLVLKPHFESLLTLSHGDVGLAPNGREVFVGGAREWFGAASGFSKDNGRIAAIDLESSAVTNVSAGVKQLGGNKEAADQHCSRGPKGWVGVTYAGPQETSGRFLMELVLWKLDGSRECVRFGVTRTNEQLGSTSSKQYRNEAHGVWRPDGRAVMFASNWQHAASAVGSVDDVKSFVLELPAVAPPPALARYYVDSAWTYAPAAGIVDRTTGKLVPLAEAARLLNLR